MALFEFYVAEETSDSAFSIEQSKGKIDSIAWLHSGIRRSCGLALVANVKYRTDFWTKKPLLWILFIAAESESIP